MAANYRALLGEDTHPGVRSAVEFRIDLRTILAALRRRHRGENEGPTDAAWGVGRWVRHIESHWTDPDFRLAGVFPGIPEARAHLEDGKALELETLVMNLVWDSLDQTAAGRHFALENVIVFLSRWDMLRRWLSYGEEAARDRFEGLAATLFADPGQSPQPTPTS